MFPSHDRARIGLLKAIRAHDPKKAKLSTLAWLYIRWEIIRYIEDQKKKMTLPLLIDKPYYTTENIWEFFPDNLTDVEKEVLTYKLEGRTLKDISKRIGGCSREWANNICKSAIKKVYEANEEKTNSNV